jgi:hypothetical protein
MYMVCIWKKLRGEANIFMKLLFIKNIHLFACLVQAFLQNQKKKNEWGKYESKGNPFCKSTGKICGGLATPSNVVASYFG